MDTEIKKYADSGDIKSLKYIFVDSLDVDPTFVRYEEEYNYCKSIPGLLEPHVELTPFKTNKADWNEEYWTSLKMDLVKNFSDRRMSHMREVARVFLADKVQRILVERASNNTVQTTLTPKVEPIRVEKTESITPTPEVTEKQPFISKAEMQKRQLEEEKRKLEAENKAQDAIRKREARERAAKIEQQHRAQTQAQYQTGGGFLKKAMGIVVAAVTVAVILILLLK